MLENNFKTIQRAFDFISVFITAVVCSQITSFFFVWRFYKGPPSDSEINEGIWIRIVVLLVTIFCYFLAFKIFSNKKHSLLYSSFTGYSVSIVAVVIIEQFLTIHFKPFVFAKGFFVEFALSLVIGNTISLIVLSIFALIKSFANKILHKRMTLP